MKQVYGFFSIVFSIATIAILSWCNTKILDQTSKLWSWYDSVVSSWPNQQNILTQEQISSLLYLIQEEKLARDVYTIMHQTRGIKKFYNILNAEENHQTLVATILEQYNIPNPNIDKDIGEFVDTELQNLYTTLLAQGKQSADQALNIGVAIETKDIEDIQQMLQIFDGKSDIKDVLQKLLLWSQRHLQAFTKN